jgi:type I restriction enzyme R subunit
VEQIIVNDALKTRFFDLVTQVDRLFKTILPDPRAGRFAPQRRLLVKLVAKIRSLGPHVDAAALEPQVTRILDDAIQARRYVIHENGIQYDLSQVDFEKLRERFERGRKRTEAEKLRGAIHAKIQRMVQRNPSRIDYQEAYQRLIDAYNAGARLGQRPSANEEGERAANGENEGLSIEAFFTQLVELAQDLKAEEKRHIRENLTEEELAVFDILTRPAPELTEAEEAQVKQAARDLLTTLKREKLVLDWKKRQQYRAAVRLTIQNLLYDRLPEGYSTAQCEQKRDDVYRHIYDTYTSAEQHVYAEGYRYPAA